MYDLLVTYLRQIYKPREQNIFILYCASLGIAKPMGKCKRKHKYRSSSEYYFDEFINNRNPQTAGCFFFNFLYYIQFYVPNYI